jgi:cytochrome P450
LINIIPVSWILLYISYNKEWKRLVSEEVNALIKRHVDTTSSDPLHKRLSAIPLAVWEDEMPILEAVIRETIRLILNRILLRRNNADGLHIGEAVVPMGHFVAYPLEDVHMNPDIYTNPTRFDPLRFSPSREEDKKQVHAYLGWGAGQIIIGYYGRFNDMTDKVSFV